MATIQDEPYSAPSQREYDSEDYASDEKHTLMTTSSSTLEAQPLPSALPLEYAISFPRKFACLAIYFALSLGITLSNKAVLQTARYPWTLTTLHASITSLGCAILLRARWFELTRLGTRENLVLVAFSFLFTLNIAISNVSLALVSVPFHQVIRSTCPVVTILIYRGVYRRSYAVQTYMTMVPLIGGVALATYGDYSATPAGIYVSLLGVLLASVKSVVSNRLMTGSLKLSALEILFRMSPLAAAQCFVYACVTGEVGQLRVAWAAADDDATATAAFLTTPFLCLLVTNVCTAFLLNIVSFETNKVAGALTISVGSNIKQILTIIFGIVLFSVQVSLWNGVGMFVTVLGAAWYSVIELKGKS